jgi:hypothetical protein
MKRKMFWLTPIAASIIQLVLSAIILFVVETIYPPKQPEIRIPGTWIILVFCGLTEALIGYLVSLTYIRTNKHRNMVLLIYGILYLVFSICMGLLIGDNSLGKNDTLISISIFMVPAIMYLIPYMYGTIRFYEPDKQ